MKIYPNPISEKIVTIEYDGYEKGSEYFLYDHLGQLLEDGNTDQYPFVIALNYLEMGVYYMKIDSGELIHTGKFTVVD